MLRFFSRRHKPRRDQKAGALERYGNLREGPPPPGGNAAGYRDRDPRDADKRKKDKNLLPCRVILLDGADLPIDIQVGENA
jgi:hypothetical protein